MPTIRWRTLLALLKDAWPTGLALGGVALSFFVSWLFSVTLSAAVRHAGTMLQVLGLATVAIGLSEMRRLFGRPSLRRRVAAWFRRVIATFRTPEPITLQASGSFSAAWFGEARVVRGVPPGAPLEDRVAVLEDNLGRLRDELDAKEEKIRREMATVREGLEHESQERRVENQRMAQTVEEVAVGGLHLEFVGLIWLVLGVLGTSIPDEIAAFLRLTL